MPISGDARCRQCRREGVKLYLKGTRCYSKKCGIERRNYAPGMHGQGMQKKMTEYATQLREKQKMKRTYRVMEKPFRNYLAEAERKRGVTGENLLALLEVRLDNTIYRLNLASSRAQARQFVTHRHFLVNGKRVNIPSFLVKPGDVITVHDNSRKLAPMLASLSGMGRHIPDWLNFDASTLTGKVVSLPTRDLIDTDVEEQLIVEYYSR
ncbi:30S ribosomal protein S4 [Capsulimonas corticalis]|uniref:Small ribosomal subunit protein uS4 n=1 Tax=Capsulimonas corticalis TaxID=2219043 RepID=A0A402CYH1_9BACT|nr:30S ribosomal protein S4 [Capsulimonas corticalis]BDI31336.1 30S ribosomal protein S4 [Capsulimonas corticalis]